MPRSLGAPVAAYFRSFSPARRPLLSRRSYAWELRAAAMLPIAVACVEGNVLGVLANKAFQAHEYVVAAIAAATPIALLSSPLWARLFHRRDRIRTINVLQLATVACVAAVAAAPFNATGVAILLVAAYLARLCLTGVITGRSDVWRANYPRADRARATGAITIVTTIAVALTALVIARSMDVEGLAGHGYRAVYALAIVAGLAGVWAYAHVRWRGRARHLAHERGLSDLELDVPGPRAMIRVLKRDHLYRRFMIAQFILGAPNIAAMPTFIIALEDVFAPDYTRSILLVHVIPIAIPALVIPLWARFLDRVHVIRFRALHSWTFVLANTLLAIGFLAGLEPVIWAARVTLGVAFGGGMLAWSLGHHDFATRELAGIYMGIHATLTGVRGFIAPFLGVMLYAGAHTGDLTIVPSLGGWVFLVLAATGAVGALMFVRLAALHRRLHGDDAPGE
jgi:hypothetical protein